MMYFIVTKFGNLSLNILKLFQQKKIKKKKKGCHKRGVLVIFFCKMKYLFCKTTKLDNLQMMESLAAIFA